MEENSASFRPADDVPTAVAPTTAGFDAACGLFQPLRLCVEHADGRRLADGELEQPFALIGSDPECEIALNDSDLPGKLAFLQVIDGRAFVVSLPGFAVHRLTPLTPFAAGPFTLRLAEAIAEQPGPRIDDPLRSESPDSRLPRVSLRFLNGRGAQATWEVNRRLAVIGGAAGCKVHLDSVDVAEFHAYLTHTPDGLWVTDLLSATGTRINGEPVRFAKLEDGDELRVGSFRIACRYSDVISRQEGLTPVGRFSEALLGGNLSEPPEEEPETDLVPLVPTPSAAVAVPAGLDPAVVALLQQVAQLHGQLFLQFRDALEGMMERFGEEQDRQVEELRAEIAHLRQLNESLAEHRRPSGITVLPSLPVEAPHHAPTPAPQEPPPVRPDSAAIHQDVFDRIAALSPDRGLWSRLFGKK